MSFLLRFISSHNSQFLRANYSAAGAITSTQRYLSLNSTKYQCTAAVVDSPSRKEEEAAEAKEAATTQKLKDNDRTKIIPLETSVRYLASDAYRQTYGDKFVWEQYRRNHKGGFAPRKTRRTCVRKGMISTGNPCPICRDEYLVLDHRNLELLKQFISPQTGEILSYSRTGLCQKKHQQLIIAVKRAMDCGLITFEVPFRQYDYSEYYDKELLKANNII